MFAMVRSEVNTNKFEPTWWRWFSWFLLHYKDKYKVLLQFDHSIVKVVKSKIKSSLFAN